MPHPIARRSALCAIASGLLGAGVTPAFAEESYPSRPIRMIVPFPPGSTSDLAARAVAQAIQQPLQQPVIVENKPGANGAIGMSMVAKSKPDGYTIVVGSISSTAVPAVMQRTPAFDLARDFAPVAVIAGTPLLLVVRSDSPYQSLQELLQAARQAPGKLTYSNSAGLFQLAMESLKMQAGVDISEIAYKGPSDATNDLLAGRITVQPDSLGAARRFIDAGRTRPLAILSSERIASLPGVPTMQELGYKDFDFNGWIGILAPAGTPAAVVERLHAAIDKAIHQPDIQKVYAGSGMDAVTRNARQYQQLLQQEMDKYQKIRIAAKIEQR